MHRFSHAAEYCMDSLSEMEAIAPESSWLIRVFTPGDEYLNGFLDFTMHNGGRRDPEAMYVGSGDPYGRDSWIIEATADHILDTLKDKVPWLWTFMAKVPVIHESRIAADIAVATGVAVLEKGHKLCEETFAEEAELNVVPQMRYLGRIADQWKRRVEMLGLSATRRFGNMIMPMTPTKLIDRETLIEAYYDLPEHPSDVAWRMGRVGMSIVGSLAGPSSLLVEIDRRELKAMKKAAVKSYELAIRVFGRETTEAMARGAEVVLGTGKFEYRVKVNSIMQLGHGGFTISMHDPATQNKIAHMCIFVDEAPTFDQLVAFKMMIDTEEDMLIEDANITITAHGKEAGIGDYLRELRLDRFKNRLVGLGGEANADRFYGELDLAQNSRGKTVVRESFFSLANNVEAHFTMAKEFAAIGSRIISDKIRNDHQLVKPENLDFDPRLVKIDVERAMAL